MKTLDLCMKAIVVLCSLYVLALAGYCFFSAVWGPMP